MKYFIKVQANHDCFIADVDGDPGRTTIAENARVYSDKKFAENQRDKFRSKYPNRDFEVVKAFDFLPA